MTSVLHFPNYTAEFGFLPEIPHVQNGQVLNCSFRLIIVNIYLMLFAAAWMDLELIILSEASQTEKDKYHMTSL